MDKITDSKKLGKSETRYKTISKGYILEKEYNSGGGQASYNLPEKFFNELIKRNILVESESVKARNNHQNKIFKIDERFKVILSNSIQNLLNNPITEEKPPLFLVVEGNGNKPQIRHSTYDEYKKENLYQGYNLEWFKELYNNNSEGNIMVYTFENNTFTIDMTRNDNIENIIIENFEVANFEINKPHQRIFFGAPGTGKSYLLNEDAKKYFGNDYERVTFHPNYMYGNFIGTFKPFPVKLENEKETIMYKYIPGVLLRLLIKAIKNPATNYLLIIEEINRANTAAVFGDFFQLLDRNGNGESEYGIAVSEDLKLYLEEQFDKNNLTENEKRYLGEKLDKITLPPNFYIWATMNSADQGVMPLDTAFKRRWEFEYTGINDAYNKSRDESGKSEFDDYKFKANENELAKWNDFRVKINEILSKCHVSEDKLLGPYFVSKSILDSKDIDKITNTIKNKVLMYLYEDAGRQHRKRIFKEGKWETYSKLCEAFDENCEEMFNDKVELPGKTPIEKAEEINEGIKEQSKESEEQSQENETELTENAESINE